MNQLEGIMTCPKFIYTITQKGNIRRNILANNKIEKVEEIANVQDEDIQLSFCVIREFIIFHSLNKIYAFNTDTEKIFGIHVREEKNVSIRCLTNKDNDLLFIVNENDKNILHTAIIIKDLDGDPELVIQSTETLRGSSADKVDLPIHMEAVKNKIDLHCQGYLLRYVDQGEKGRRLSVLSGTLEHIETDKHIIELKVNGDLKADNQIILPKIESFDKIGNRFLCSSMYSDTIYLLNDDCRVISMNNKSKLEKDIISAYALDASSDVLILATTGLYIMHPDYLGKLKIASVCLFWDYDQYVYDYSRHYYWGGRDDEPKPENDYPRFCHLFSAPKHVIDKYSAHIYLSLRKCVNTSLARIIAKFL